MAKIDSTRDSILDCGFWILETIMAKIEITKTELVWPGKYDEDGTLKEVPRVSLPFQVIETVNESRTTREAKKGSVQGGLFDIYAGKEGDTFLRYV